MSWSAVGAGRSVCRRRADRLQLRDIAAQLLGHPKETLTDVIASFDEIAGLFEVMAAESRSVLIIDDAEGLAAVSAGISVRDGVHDDARAAAVRVRRPAGILGR